MEDQHPKNIEQDTPTQAKMVMVIDDDEDWIFIARKMLKRAGLQQDILTAKNGLDALSKINQLVQTTNRLPEVIFLDIKMPVMDGFKFLEEVNKPNVYDLRQTKIYMCSSSISQVDKETANSFPVSGFLTKPISVEDIQEALS